MAKGTKKKTEDKAVDLKTVLWNCRVALRGVGSTEKNRDAVIGLTFLKFAGDKFEKRRAEILGSKADAPFVDEPSFYTGKNSGFYLREKSRWSYIVKHAGDDDIATLLDNAMSDIDQTNEQLTGALPVNLYTTLGASQAKLKTLIDEVNKIDEKRFSDEDLIGRVYEYFLQIYAAAGTKEDGEFYTPASVVQLIAELIEPYNGTVYDPCCGSGGMFVQSLKFVDRHNGNRKMVSVLGQESNLATWKLAKMNLAIRGISHNLGESNGSTFTEEQHKGIQVDYIMANPPFNLKDWRKENQLTRDPRFSGFKVPPVSNANYAWILHMLSKLKTDRGIAGFLLANGALNADGDEYEIRKELIERDKIEAIIVLPRDMFYTTDTSVTLWILNQNKKARTLNGRKLRDRTHEILFVDLRPWEENINIIKIDAKLTKKKVFLSDEQIAKVVKLYQAWQGVDRKAYRDIPELCKSVKLDGKGGVRDMNYSLAPSKYIEFIDRDLEINYKKEMKRIQKEMAEVLTEEKTAQKLLIRSFKGIGYGID